MTAVIWFPPRGSGQQEIKSINGMSFHGTSDQGAEQENEYSLFQENKGTCTQGSVSIIGATIKILKFRTPEILL